VTKEERRLSRGKAGGLLLPARGLAQGENEGEGGERRGERNPIVFSEEEEEAGGEFFPREGDKSGHHSGYSHLQGTP